MNKPSKLSLYIIIAILCLALTYLIVYTSANDVNALRLQARADRETIENLQDLVDRKDFAWTACDLEVDNLETIIASKDELILGLRVEAEILELYKSALENAVTYVYYAQTLLDDAGVPYFEFIADTVLDDNYFEELEEQVEFFEEVGE